MRITHITILLFITSILWSQNENSNIDSIIVNNKHPPFISYLPKLKFETGVINSLDVGISFIDFDSDDILTQVPVWFYAGPFLESGFSFKEKNHLMNTKIGFECFYLFWGGRVNLIHFTNFEKNQFSIRPEIGFSFLSVITLTYGYNINLSSHHTLVKNGSVISINFAVPIQHKSYKLS